MIAPAQITAFFELPAYADTFFTIEHPVLGSLDGPGVLAGPVATDISNYGTSIRVQRGRAFELDPIGTGTATVVLKNVNREFDSMNTAGPFYGNLVPGKRIELAIYGQRIFTGVADLWPDAYATNSISRTSLRVIDALGQLARCEFDEWLTTPQTPGARLTAILDRNEVRFDGPRSLDAGIETLQADLVTWGSNVLNYAQLVAQTDLGRLFASRNGVLTFRDRLAVGAASVRMRFADDGAGIEFMSVTKRDDLLFTTVSVDREGGNAQTATNEAARAEFGMIRLPISGVLLANDIRSMSMAEFLLGIYSKPSSRVVGLTFNVHRIEDPAVQALLCSLELGDLVDLEWTPNGIGDPIVRTLVVEGIDHDITASGPHYMTLALSDFVQRGLFTIEHPVLGRLDTGGVLAF